MLRPCGARTHACRVDTRVDAWRRVATLLYVALLQTSAAAQPANPLKALQFLQGDWIGEGAGDPGQGKGGFSFRPDLDGRVLVRKNLSEYPATKDRPAARHEDLMIVHPDAGGKLAAIYFDNEGHVIRYGVQASGATATFVSKPIPGAPSYRLTYTMTAKDAVNIRFEIAPPDKPDEFKTYLTATARRK